MRWLLFCLSVLCCLSMDAYADKLLLTSGKSVEGRIISQDDRSTVIDTGVGTPLTYYSDEIVNIIVAPFADPTSLADKLENEAVALIDSGQRDKGLAKMLKAIELDPSPLRRMNYGSVLFGDGVELYKKGSIEEAKKILHECERQLQLAIKEFSPSTDAAYLSQSYFLLGEIDANAFGNIQEAKVYYNKAVKLFDHPAAKEALEKINNPL